MAQVFFSYSRKDSDFVDKLIAELESQGIDIWVDRGDILAGEAWRNSIVEAIINCPVFVIVLSPNSISSENVTKELTLAEQHKKRILPLVIKEVQIPPSLDYQLAGLQYQTFVEGSYASNFERLTRSLGALGIVTAPAPKPEPQPVVEPKPENKTEMEPASTAILPPIKTEIEPSQPTPASLPYIPQSTPTHPQPITNPLQKIPVWLWAAGGGLLVVIVLAIIFSSLFGKDDRKKTATATADQALVISTPTEEFAVPPTDITEPTAYPLRSLDDFDVPMVLVSAGPFMMGTSSAEALKECQKVNSSLNCEAFYFGDEEPVRTVTLDYDFYMDQYEVTNERYDACVTAGVCDSPWNFNIAQGVPYFRNAQYTQYPVVNVTWDAANTYCEWRNGRLPTETEWEKAARGPEDARKYPWGENLEDTRANFCDRFCGNSWANHAFSDGYPYTAPVGTFTNGASPYGVEDMAGNVSEWVADLYGPYPDGEADTGSDFYGQERIRRGGSWYSLGSDLRVSRRDKNLPEPYIIDPNAELGKIGFRCVRELP